MDSDGESPGPGGRAGGSGGEGWWLRESAEQWGSVAL